MANIRALVNRRRAVRNIRKITRTMELIAAARFKKALDRAVEADAFTRKIAEVAADVSAAATDVTHPLLQKREQVKNSLLLVINSNRGLCGGYNAGILREAQRRIREVAAEGATLHLELSGRRGIQFFRYQRVPAEQTYTQFEDKPRFEEVDVLANRYLAEFIAGKLDRIDVAYMRFQSAARQSPVVETLLPLAGTKVEHTPHRLADAARHAAPKTPVEYEFLPGAKDILEVLLPLSFKVQLFKCFLDAAVGEQIARRVAMSAATENADEMIKGLTRMYNRTRQAQITKELSEVIGGAAALE